MNNKIRSFLIEKARRRRAVSYGELNDHLDLGYDFSITAYRAQLGDVLEEISLFENNARRPVLSSLVVHNDKNQRQGDGFYKMCQDLFDTPWEELKKDRGLERKIQERCFDYWSNDENYKNHKEV